MKITAGILFYLLNDNAVVQHICHGADRMPLERFSFLRDQTAAEPGVLYMHADTNGVRLICSDQRVEVTVLQNSRAGDKESHISSLWIPQGDPDILGPQVMKAWSDFTRIQNEILELILLRKETGEIMKKAGELLRKPFIIVDRDMLSIYQQPEIARRMKAELGENYESEILEELLLAKEFHEAAKKREPFYYWMKNVEEGSYCVNIVVDENYYARLVVYLDIGCPALSSGEEQITEYIAWVVVQMIRNGVMQLHSHEKDRLHTLCHQLLEGQSPSASEICAAVESHHWKINHDYQVLCLEPFSAAGWDPQIENTMPNVTRKLEQIWPDSCAVYSGKRILWLLNLTLSEGEAGAYEQSQTLMCFLRDNVLRAGASSLFRDVSLLTSALIEAEAALRTGTETEPDYWYYRFDDFRMTYMINAIREKGIAPMLLVHPAISILKEHDRSNESELTETLQVFLENRQNVTRTANALFVHRTTLFRWLNQIRELTGLDFENREQMLELEVSYRILKEI